MGGAAAYVRPSWRWCAGALLTVTAALLVAWALARPALPVAVTTIRAVSDLAAVASLGLAVVPLLDAARYRAELTGRARRPLVAVGAVWLVAELTTLLLVAAQAVGVSAVALSLPTAVAFASATAAGRAALFGIAAAGCVTALAAATGSGPLRGRALIAAAAAGVAARALTGHLSGTLLGGVAVVAHALAAALWCGVLAALALTVRARGQWARMLPAFSQLALWCVGVLLTGGLVAGAAVLGSPAELYTSGHGRILLAKVVLTAALLALAWRNRVRWLAQARRHRIRAEQSLARAAVELSLMAAVLTLAAALTMTG